VNTRPVARTDAAAPGLRGISTAVGCRARLSGGGGEVPGGVPPPTSSPRSGILGSQTVTPASRTSLDNLSGVLQGEATRRGSPPPAPPGVTEPLPVLHVADARRPEMVPHDAPPQSCSPVAFPQDVFPSAVRHEDRFAALRDAGGTEGGNQGSLVLLHGSDGVVVSRKGNNDDGLSCIEVLFYTNCNNNCNNNNNIVPFFLFKSKNTRNPDYFIFLILDILFRYFYRNTTFKSKNA